MTNAAPLWLRRLLLTAMETALTEGDLIRLELDDVDWDEGVIVSGGGRKKTHVRQAAPLTALLRALFEEMKHEYRQAKVKNLSTAALVFIKDGKPISANMIHKAIRKACKTANVKDFRFHDTRHIAKTAWARAGIPVEAAMLGAGHKSVQMHRAYIHLQTSDVGKAFGTATTFYNSFKTEKDVANER